MTALLRDLLRDSADRLLAVSAADDLDEARLEVELLYGRAADLDRVHVIAAGGEAPDPAALEPFEALLQRRVAHEPLAYILGEREFYGLTFYVGEGALVPRPETETLVEAALAAIHEHPRHRRLVRVADIGTGTGIIAISVARHAPEAKVFAVDASTAALQWAGNNLRRLGPMDRVVLLTGDLLDPLSEPLDVVLANLPYVPTEEYETLPDEIRAHEPQLAVDGGEDGLDIYRRFAEQLPAHLVDDTYAVLVEVGAGQALFAEDILLDALGRPANAEVRMHRDLRDIRRVIEVRVGY